MIATGRSGSSASGGAARRPASTRNSASTLVECRRRGAASSITSFGSATVEHRVALALRQPVVDAGGDRAELRRRAVREEVLGPGRQHERDDVALADAPRGEPDRDFVGDAIDVGVR